MDWFIFLRYRPPEVLLGSIDYDSEIDMWCVYYSLLLVCVCVHTCVHVCVHACIHIHMCLYVCMHMCMRA